MTIELLENCEVPMAHYERHCECCGSYRVYPDTHCWYPKGERLDPEDLYNEIDLVAHKDTFVFGRHYTIVAYP